MTLELLMKTLARIEAEDLRVIRTETLQQLLSILLQQAELVSDYLDWREDRQSPR